MAYGRENHVVKCRLDNGEIIEYDLCGKSKNSYSDMDIKYLGEGIIWSFNGKRQTGKERFHFFKKN